MLQSEGGLVIIGGQDVSGVQELRYQNQQLLNSWLFSLPSQPHILQGWSRSLDLMNFMTRQVIVCFTSLYWYEQLDQLSIGDTLLCTVWLNNLILSWCLYDTHFNTWTYPLSLQVLNTFNRFLSVISLLKDNKYLGPLWFGSQFQAFISTFSPNVLLISG